MAQRSGMSAHMSKIKNGGLDQYGAEPFERQQFGLSGIEGVKDDHFSELTLVNEVFLEL